MTDSLKSTNIYLRNRIRAFGVFLFLFICFRFKLPCIRIFEISGLQKKKNNHVPTYIVSNHPFVSMIYFSNTFSKKYKYYVRKLHGKGIGFVSIIVDKNQLYIIVLLENIQYNILLQYSETVRFSNYKTQFSIFFFFKLYRCGILLFCPITHLSVGL